jgi:hypothetical protein
MFKRIATGLWNVWKTWFLNPYLTSVLGTSSTVVAHYVFNTSTNFCEWHMHTSGWCTLRMYAYNFICLWEGHTEMWNVCFHTGAVLVTVWKCAANQVQRLSQFCKFPELLFVTRACDSVNCPENIWSYSTFYYSEGYNVALT